MVKDVQKGKGYPYEKILTKVTQLWIKMKEFIA